jgi:sirohydrochlorin cobaltochelatase
MTALLVGFEGAIPLALADSDVGVVVLAAPGPRTWMKTVQRAVKDAKIPYPTRIFFGAGDSSVQQGNLQDDIRELEDEGAHTIAVVPLDTMPFSPSFRQWKYLLGSGFQPGFNNVPLFPVQKNSTIQFGEPLNDSAVVVEILLDRIQEISRKAAEESVIILAQGPRDEGDNDEWDIILQRLTKRIQERGRFKRVEAAILRDDAPSEARQAALSALRKKVDHAAQDSARVLVVSLMLSSGGVEHKISLELRGLPYIYNNKALLPDDRISEWIRSQLP